MFGSPILDVAIGMALIYLLLSLIASAVQEILASLIQARAANLERGLQSLFSGDSFLGEEKFLDLLYKHGLVRGLYQDPKSDFGFGVAEPKVAGAIRMATGWVKGAVRIALGAQPPGKPFHPDQLLLPSYIPARTFALAVTDILNGDRRFGPDSLGNIEDTLLQLLQKFPDNKAVQALLCLYRDAQGKPEKLQANLENWYNDAMDRVSGWYKRYVQKVLIVIGFVIALSLNVDSVKVAKVLWFNKEARASLVATATDLTKNPPADVKAGADTTPPLTTEQRGKKLMDAVSIFNNDAAKALLPVGWSQSPEMYLKHSSEWTWMQLFQKLTGWIVTAIALSLGAPFWFDTLNKFMVVRGTVKPQEKSQTDKSKDG